MLTNAVTAAAGRLYANTPITETRLQVERIEPMTRLAGAGRGLTASERDAHDDRNDAAQRSALTEGVRLVFESASGVDSPTAESGEPEIAGSEPIPTSEQAEPPAADPNLEGAILQFIHSVFRSISAADDKTVPDAGAHSHQAPSGGGGGDRIKAHFPAAGSSREMLGRRIESLVEQLGAEGDPTDRLADESADSASTGEIERSFVAVVQALGVNSASTTDDAVEPAIPSRADLVKLLHKLAIAMQGSPLVDDRLPTVGALLHARA